MAFANNRPKNTPAIKKVKDLAANATSEHISELFTAVDLQKNNGTNALTQEVTALVSLIAQQQPDAVKVSYQYSSDDEGRNMITNAKELEQFYSQTDVKEYKFDYFEQEAYHALLKFTDKATGKELFIPAPRVAPEEIIRLSRVITGFEERVEHNRDKSTTPTADIEILNTILSGDNPLLSENTLGHADAAFTNHRNQNMTNPKNPIADRIELFQSGQWHPTKEPSGRSTRLIAASPGTTPQIAQVAAAGF